MLQNIIKNLVKNTILLVCGRNVIFSGCQRSLQLKGQLLKVCGLKYPFKYLYSFKKGLYYTNHVNLNFAEKKSPKFNTF